MARNLVKYWLPVLAWLGVIFLGSSDLMSAEHTSRFIGPFLRWLRADISAETIVAVQFFVRKIGHLIEYALLAALLFRALLAGADRARLTAVSSALLIALACAALDEFHQSFVASRTGSSGDVMIDLGGAVLGAAVYWIFAQRSARKFAAA